MPSFGCLDSAVVEDLVSAGDLTQPYLPAPYTPGHFLHSFPDSPCPQLLN